MQLLAGKVAVITGAGSGIGKATAAIFVREGAQVVVTDVSGAQDQTAADLGPNALALHCDVTNEGDVEAAVRAASEHYGRLDAMLNVAGIATGAMIKDITRQHYDTTLDVDLRGVLHGMKHAIRSMLESKTPGSIINVSSAGGLNGSPGTSVYSAAKAGVNALTKAGAVEYGHKGIRVNAICPGFIKTEIMGATIDQIPGSSEKAALSRVGMPEEVAELAAFLACDRASFISGAIIPVDGGWTAKLA